VKVRDLYRSEHDERPNLHIVQPPRPITVAPEAVKADLTEGPVVAYLIASEVLGCNVWFALDDSFKADDELAVFYADELPFLATKDAETLNEIHKYKLAFPGSRVRQ
jgi:hypothetical protein